ncbi:hypothetical protein Tco_0508249 [Tanacetum coccineum]
MATLVIPISSDSSKESVGSHVPRVILFGTIPTSILVIPVVPAEVPIAPADPLVVPEVGVVSVISPTGVLDLVDYSSSSDSDPSEDSLPLAPELPLVSPFLCSDDLEADSESEPAEQRPERHESLTPSYEFPLAPIVAQPKIRRRPAILVRPGEAIPFGRPYRTHPNGQRKLLTARKRVGPFPARRLAWRRVSHRSSDRHSRLFLLTSSYYGYLGVFIKYFSVRTPQCSEAFMRWRSAPLSTLYLPTTLESSLDLSFERSLDSSSSFAGPSRKRCRSPTTLVPSSTPVLRSIAPALADLPPRKRFRDSYSSEVSKEEHMEIGTADAKTVADLGISDRVRAHTEDGIGMGVEVVTSDIREDEEEFEAKASAGGTMEITVDPLATDGISESTRGDAPDLEGTLYDIAHYMSEVPLDRIIEFETAQRQLEVGQLVASGERDGLTDWVRSLRRENLRVQALLCIERYHVDSLGCHMTLSQEEFHQICRDCDDTRRRLRMLELLVERCNGYSQKDKNRAKKDKTEHEIRRVNPIGCKHMGYDLRAQMMDLEFVVNQGLRLKLKNAPHGLEPSLMCYK